MNFIYKLSKIIAIGSFVFLVYALISIFIYDGPKKIYGSRRGEQYWECRDVLHIFHDHEDYYATDTKYGAYHHHKEDVFVAVIWSLPIFVISTVVSIASKNHIDG